MVEVEFVREVGVFGIVSRYPCDPTGPRAEKRRMQGLPVPQGGFHKAGEVPAFGGLWFLSGSRKEPPAGSAFPRLTSLKKPPKVNATSRA